MIDTAVAVPPTSDVKPQTPVSVPPRRTRFSPSHPLRLWTVGDSLVIVPGESLLRAVAGNRAIDASSKVDGRIATGLERPDVFNWFTDVRNKMRSKDRPGAVVAMFGGNDDHDFMTGLPPGEEIGPFGSPSWTAEDSSGTITRNIRGVDGQLDAISGASGPSTTPRLSVVADAITMPGRSIGLTAPAGLNPSAGS